MSVREQILRRLAYLHDARSCCSIFSCVRKGCMPQQGAFQDFWRLNDGLPQRAFKHYLLLCTHVQRWVLTENYATLRSTFLARCPGILRRFCSPLCRQLFTVWCGFRGGRDDSNVLLSDGLATGNPPEDAFSQLQGFLRSVFRRVQGFLISMCRETDLKWVLAVW